LRNPYRRYQILPISHFLPRSRGTGNASGITGHASNRRFRAGAGGVYALNRSTGAIVYRHQLPTSTNAPIAVFGNTVLVPAGGPQTSASGGGGNPQLIAYTVR